jgi:hypothetical protein
LETVHDELNKFLRSNIPCGWELLTNSSHNVFNGSHDHLIVTTALHDLFEQSLDDNWDIFNSFGLADCIIDTIQNISVGGFLCEFGHDEFDHGWNCSFGCSWEFLSDLLHDTANDLQEVHHFLVLTTSSSSHELHGNFLQDLWDFHDVSGFTKRFANLSERLTMRVLP